MGTFWSSPPDHRVEPLRKEAAKYYSLLDDLAPLPRKEDGEVDVYEVVVDGGNSFSTKDQGRPVRDIQGSSYHDLQDKAIRSRSQIVNLASYTTIPHDTSMGTIEYVCCDLID